jgi:ABC-type transporter MlaC component
MMDQNEKLKLMREAIDELSHKTLENEQVAYSMDEFAMNMHFKNEGLPNLGMTKIASYAASIGITLALGVDMQILMLSYQGSADEIDKAYKTMMHADLVPTEA